MILIIVDGFGIGPKDKGNAVYQANTPNWDELTKKYPMVEISASGKDVGLPDGIMGNSEVGHLTIGSGRIIYQSLERINRSIKENSLVEKEEIKSLINHLKTTGGKLHLMGLLSDGKVHSDQAHLHALIDIFRDHLDNQIYIHAFTDGRDTPTDSSPKFIGDLQEHLEGVPNAELATIVGRYYAMDRDEKWERTERAYRMLVHGEGQIIDQDPINEIQSRYKINETDEFLKPIIVEPKGTVSDGDGILFYNYRPDRARQLTQAFNYKVDFDTVNFDKLHFVTMTEYDEEWDLPVLFESIDINNTLTEILSKAGIPQIHIAETEKYAHVTYFINGGVEKKFDLEERILVPSPKIPTYDEQPEMSTPQITEETLKAIETQNYPFIVLNIACPDMVGHTGNLDAAIKSVEAMDDAFGKIYQKAQEYNYKIIITADHGNVEKMIHEGSIHTAHTTNNVPFLITLKNKTLRSDGGLKHVAPTILSYMGQSTPDEMTKETMFD